MGLDLVEVDLTVSVKFRPEPMTQSCEHASVQDVFRTHGADLVRGKWPQARIEVGRRSRDWRDYIQFGALLYADGTKP